MEEIAVKEKQIRDAMEAGNPRLTPPNTSPSQPPCMGSTDLWHDGAGPQRTTCYLFERSFASGSQWTSERGGSWMRAAP